MKVLILGGAGYIGSVLSEYLTQKGDDVRIMDKFLYEKNKKLLLSDRFIYGDICNINDILPLIESSDAIVNLAAISNDPASDLQPDLTWKINYKANEIIAKLSQATGKRVVYASSCSVYGFAKNKVFYEDSKLSPVTLYARTKMLSESFYLHGHVNGIVLRFATVYGNSPKPRFDLVVNTMVGTSYFNGKIVVNGGNQWRPIVHVKDVAQAIYLALHEKTPKHRIYNVGSNEQNYQINELAKIINKELPKIELENKEGSIDNRSYKVNFDLIQEDLKFKAKYTVADAVKELYLSFEKGLIKNMEEDEYFRVKYLKKRMNPGYLKRILGRQEPLFTIQG